MEFDWQRECITPDWSVTAWAEKGQVTVKHRDGIETDEFPHIKKKTEEEEVED